MRSVAIFLCAVILLVSVGITFGLDGFPSWKTVFAYFGFEPDFDASRDYLQVMDVGQADCILLQSNGKSMLIDAGLTTASQTVKVKLKNVGFHHIDGIAVTHAHTDHIGGLYRLSEIFKVKTLIIPNLTDIEDGIDCLRQARNQVRRDNRGTVYTLREQMWFDVGDFTVRVIWYDPGQKDENDRSAVMTAEIDGVNFLLMGDATSTLEKAMLKDGAISSCDVLKVGHHGSKQATSEEFLAACRPQYAAISCGLNNTFSHPHEETLSRLEKYGVKVYRTDLNGDITFYVDDGKLSAVIGKE